MATEELQILNRSLSCAVFLTPKLYLRAEKHQTEAQLVHPWSRCKKLSVDSLGQRHFVNWCALVKHVCQRLECDVSNASKNILFYLFIYMMTTTKLDTKVCDEVMIFYIPNVEGRLHCDILCKIDFQSIFFAMPLLRNSDVTSACNVLMFSQLYKHIQLHV